MTRLRGALIAGWLALAAGSAGATPDEDPDAVAERAPTVWDEAIDPDGTQVARALAAASTDGPPSLEALDAIVAAHPRVAAAYAARAERRYASAAWLGCAEDVTTYFALAGADAALPPPATLHAARCLARTAVAADQARAIALLRGEVAAGRGVPEVRLALSATLLAAGRPDAAIDAAAYLRATAMGPTASAAAWLLAVAHDRAGEFTEALDQARAAVGRDLTLGLLSTPAVPFVTTTDRVYAKLLGFVASGQPARALVHARALRGDSSGPRPTRLAALTRTAEAAEVGGGATVLGTSGVDPVAVLRPIAGALGACLADLPRTTLLLELDAVGPTPPPRVTVTTTGDVTTTTTITETVAAITTVVRVENRRTGTTSSRTSVTPRPAVPGMGPPPARAAVRVRVLDDLAAPGALPSTPAAQADATACAMRVATPLAPTLPPATWLRLSVPIAGPAGADPAATPGTT